jgi:hypothetical protein
VVVHYGYAKPPPGTSHQQGAGWIFINSRKGPDGFLSTPQSALVVLVVGPPSDLSTFLQAPPGGPESDLLVFQELHKVTWWSSISNLMEDTR